MLSTAYLDSSQAISDLTPEITTITPNIASLSGGAEVVIKGKNFTSDSIVILGDNVALNTVVESSEQIRFRTPEQIIPGSRTLTLETSSGVVQKEFFIKSKSLAELKDREITTVVGGAVFVGDGEDALDKSVSFFPSELTTDNQGNLFFSDTLHNRVRKLDAQTGTITTVVGNNLQGLSGDGKHALTSALNSPSGLVFDSTGNLFIADTFNHRIRRVDAKTKVITTIAGTGPIGISSGGFSGDNGLAINARLNSPTDLAIDKLGNLYIADSSNFRLRRVDANTGIITTVAGTGKFNFEQGFNGNNVPAISADVFVGSVALDANNIIYFTDFGRLQKIDLNTGLLTTIAGNGNKGFNGDGILAINSAIRPLDIALDEIGNIFICDDNSRIRRVDVKTGIITTIAGTGVSNFNGEGGPAITASLLDTRSIAIDKKNNIFIKDSNLIRRISTTGIINRIAGQLDFSFFFPTGAFRGDNSLAIQASLNFPKSVAVDNNQNIFIVDTDNNRVRKVDGKTGIITTIAGTGETGFNGDGGVATKAKINFVSQIAIDQSNNLFIADSGNDRIRRINGQTGVITTVVGTGETGFNGDGLARDASLNFPTAIVVDKQGNLFIADSDNHRVRKVDSQRGLITTIVGDGLKGFSGDNIPATRTSLQFPSGLAIEKNGNLLIADTFNHRIRRVNAQTGIITTIVGNGLRGFTGDGGLAKEARLDFPSNITLDADDNLFISDQNHNRIRRVDVQTGIITTIVGSGPTESFIGEYLGDNGLATDAKLNIPSGLAIDTSGNLLFADSENHAIRLVKGIGKKTTNFLPPTIASINDQTVKAGLTLEVPVMAKDPNGQDLTLSLVLAPDFATLTSDKNGVGTIKFSPGNKEIRQINRVVVVATNSAGLSTQTTFNITVLPNIEILSIQFSKPNLTINGVNFGLEPLVNINGKDVNKFVSSVSDAKLMLKGSKKKLGLKSGANQVTVAIKEGSSSTFILNLFVVEVD